MSSLINAIKDSSQHQPMAISAMTNLRRLLQTLLFISLSTLITACGDSANNHQQTNNTVAAKEPDPIAEPDTDEPCSHCRIYLSRYIAKLANPFK